MKSLIILCLLMMILPCSGLSLARLKYEGGGDWYNDQEALPNLAREIKKRTGVNVFEKEAVVSADDHDLFVHKFLFLTGHGKVTFTEPQVRRLKRYLCNGGFLYADDDYGLDSSFREQIARIFPDRPLQEIPAGHQIFNIFYNLPGLPKIHKHDEKEPKAYGIFYRDRLVVLYTFESNISDGWADPARHGDPPEMREIAFQMGTNIVLYALCGRN